MNSTDDSAGLIERVKMAVADATPMTIIGGNSKAALGNVPEQSQAVAVSTTSHCGIVAYEPTELVVTVRTGTPLDELNQTLLDAGQMLPFEPPVFAGSTIGGVLACGLSGPRRPFNGAARDYVLGARVINGHGQDLSFGGEVMKNVAGYDVSRLQVGAWGTLGVLLDTSMKVLPIPETELTVCHSVAEHDTASFAALLRQSLPLSAAMLIGDQRFLRLSGSESAVRAAAALLGGDTVTDHTQLWDSVRDQTHRYFADMSPVGDSTDSTDSTGETLWRISVADTLPVLPLSGEWLYEWAGAQRWLKTSEPAEAVFRAAAAAGGHAMRYSASASDTPAFQPLEGAMQRLQSRVRDSFDPQRLFNRGRFHRELDVSVG